MTSFHTGPRSFPVTKATTWSSGVGRDVGLARGALERVEPLGFSGALIMRPAFFWGRGTLV